MTERTVLHDTFVIERVYPASPMRVFAAWASPEAKAQWFGAPEEWRIDQQTLDFRVGGSETSYGGPVDGPSHRYDATYHDIAPNERIIYAYAMHLDDMLISVSLATVEFIAQGTSTRLILTEQGVYFGDADGPTGPAAREHGTGILLDQLGAALAARQS